MRAARCGVCRGMRDGGPHDCRGGGGGGSPPRADRAARARSTIVRPKTAAPPPPQAPPQAAASAQPSERTRSSSRATDSLTATARAEDAAALPGLERLIGLLGVDRYHARDACARLGERTKIGRAGGANAREQLCVDRVKMVLAMARGGRAQWREDSAVLECLQDLLGGDLLASLMDNASV